MDMTLYFVIVWQALSYGWLIIHLTLAGIAWFLERRLQLSENSLRAVENTDTVTRWGTVSQLSGYTALTNHGFWGLTPEQISSLPEARASTIGLDDFECSICLTSVDRDDNVRRLDS